MTVINTMDVVQDGLFNESEARRRGDNNMRYVSAAFTSLDQGNIIEALDDWTLHVRGNPCHGTGRLGDPTALPDIETWLSTRAPYNWFWATPGAIEHAGQPYATEAAALAAARKALGVKS